MRPFSNENREEEEELLTAEKRFWGEKEVEEKLVAIPYPLFGSSKAKVKRKRGVRACYKWRKLVIGFGLGWVGLVEAGVFIGWWASPKPRPSTLGRAWV